MNRPTPYPFPHAHNITKPERNHREFAMRIARRLPCRPLVLCLPLLLGGCAVVSRFSATEIEYDRQAEQVRDRAVLLNVLRAADRKPLLFVDVGQVTGSATASASGALSLPLQIVNSIYAGGGNASPSFSLSGGPTFALTPLVSKEFYQGIMSPVPLSLLADLVQNGLPKSLLFLLAIQRITLTDEAPGAYRSLTFRNDFFGDDAARFQAQLAALLAQGLTLETLTRTSKLGPALSTREVKANPALWGVLPNGEHLARTRPDPATHTAESWQLEATTTAAGFCFHPVDPDRAAGQSLAVPNGLAQPGNAPWLDSFFCPELAPYALIATRAEASHTGAASRLASDNGHFSIDIVTRSVEQIVYYLGELTRARLHLDPALSLPPATPNTLTQANLFAVHAQGTPGPGAITTRYADRTYWVATDPAATDHSTQVMELLIQLTALNDSAKDLPTASIVTLIPH